VLKFLQQLFDDNERELRRLRAVVDRVNALEPEVERLSDEELRGKTPEFRRRLEAGETLDELLPEAFAVVREAACRTLDMRHFDVQVMGAIVLHEGNIAEMKTGEGKTLVATMPAYLNALTGRGVHIVTVNDYLAKRDSEWMGQVYSFLGLRTGLIVHGLSSQERKDAYAADITYGTNNEIGFDYLRDNMVLYKEDIVHRDLHYAIVDEVDSILIDEARTPLIISGKGRRSTELYYRFAKIAARLEEGRDFTVDEKARTVTPTEEGIARVEKMLGVENLFDNEHMDLSHYLNQALRARCLMKRDRDYVVKDGQVIIVDEFTGRLMFGRRYSDGLHQAIEAKEGVKIEDESQTLATITFQNLFRMYDKLAGMTGTAATEAEEFRKIYGLDVVVIPTNKPMIREDLPDVILKTERAKFRAVVKDIIERHRRGQPVLVGTVSIEKSEQLSELLKREGIKHEVLNAKYHEREAQIVAQAGQRGAVTIATNMAGRGTDIVLGEGVKELGGLYIIGTERHEARRIDNQLRGRSGRQGDPGSSQFYLSLEDDLMRLFGADLIAGLMDRLGVDENEPIDHPLVSRAIEMAQKRVEARNFDIRKHVLEYDDVLNKQREVIYEQRRMVLEGDNLRENVLEMLEDVVDTALGMYAHESLVPEEWDVKGLVDHLEHLIFKPGALDREKIMNMIREDAGRREIRQQLREHILQGARDLYARREEEYGAEVMRELERVVMLRVVDAKWMDHLANMDDLREGISLRAYGQRDPLVEYKKEAYEMFQGMIESIKEDIVRYCFKLHVVREPERQRLVAVQDATHESDVSLGAAGIAERGYVQAVGGEAPKPKPVVKGKKVGRNDPCPCGSGKKYKKCCGR